MSQDFTMRRVRTAFAAQGASRLARLAEQLLLVPLLLAGWGTETFGEWIALNSLGAVAAVASLGIGHAVSADIVMRHAEGDHAAASESFVTGLALLAVSTLVGLALTGLGVWLFGTGVAAGDLIPPRDAPLILLMAAGAMLISFWIEPMVGVLSASVGAALPNIVGAAVKVVEIAAVALALALGASPLLIAAILLLSAVLNLAVDAVLVLRLAPWLSMRAGIGRAPVLRSWRAALGIWFAFLSFNLVALHAPRLIIAHAFGPAAVTVFTVLTTYTRTARSLAAMIGQSVQAEIGRAAASGQRALLAHLVASALGSSAGFAALLLIGALTVAPVVVPVWTHGQVPLDWHLLGALAIVALAGSVFDTVLNATLPLHRVMPAALAYCAGLAVGLVAGTALLGTLGLPALAGGLLLAEIAGSTAGLRTLRVHAGLRLRNLSFQPWRFLLARSGER
jgi:O-antigen/teichoic acid export membrane protein